MKSIEKLREIASRLDDAAASVSEHGFSPIAIKASLLCDEIEAEIAERYMLLPVDADGVPIHVGDELFNKNKPTDVYKVTAIADNGYLRIYHDTAHIHSSQCRHVKPDPLKELLTEMLDRNSDGVGLREFNRDFGAFVAHYADEIRELLGGDAE